MIEFHRQKPWHENDCWTKKSNLPLSKDYYSVNGTLLDQTQVLYYISTVLYSIIYKKAELQNYVAMKIKIRKGTEKEVKFTIYA